ncbi:MAG: signal peptidase I [Microbacteriaceae bacterium]
MGILGSLALLWFVFSLLTGASIVIFKTGSMAPTIPQGGAAIILPTKAKDLSVGDIITVQRGENVLPVTHRIVSISEVGTDTNIRELILKGDDNTNPDPVPYQIERAGKVILSAPSAGNILLQIQTPIAIAVLTLVSGALITFAFWPQATTLSTKEE